MQLIDKMRDELGFPFPVNSAYRSPLHPIEVRKEKPGAHASGQAIDIGVSGGRAIALIECAQRHGITRIGIQQKGPIDGRFIPRRLQKLYLSRNLELLMAKQTSFVYQSPTKSKRRKKKRGLHLRKKLGPKHHLRIR